MTKRMTVLAAFAATALLAVSCKKVGEGPPPGKSDGAITKVAPTLPKTGGPVVPPAGAAGATCFPTCMRQLAMRAVSAEQNDKDCRARCQVECFDPCKARSAMRAVGAAQIDADCKATCGL